MGQSHSVEKLYNKCNAKGALLDSFALLRSCITSANFRRTRHERAEFT